MTSQAALFDVVVVGSGAAGMTAAIAARVQGLNVLLCEAEAQVGGTTATSAGTLWLPQVHGEQAPDSHEEVLAYLRAAVGAGLREDMADAFLAGAPQLLDFLARHTPVRMARVPVHPDYLQSLPGASATGRAYAPGPFDGRRLGADFTLVRPPRADFMVLGGMMVGKDDIAHLLAARKSVRSARRAVALLGRHALDRLRHPRGTRLVMGNALVAGLLAAVREQGIHLALRTRVASLEPQAGGWRLRLAGPTGARTVVARRGVILATGGYSTDFSLRGRLLPEQALAHTLAMSPACANGIALGLAAGGQLDTAHSSPAFWMPVSLLARPDGSVNRFPHIVLDRAKPGCIAVDGSGRRFTNEADAYHHFCLAMLRHAQPARGFFLVADGAFVRRHGLGLVRPGGWGLRRLLAQGYLTTAPSPQVLAARLGIDGAALQQTIEEFNGHAAAGADPEFGRGQSALNRHNGDPDQRPNPNLRPLDTGELFAVELHVADLATSCGLLTGTDGQLLDAHGQPIAGLYACGNDMASMMRGAYPGPGATLGPGMVFALRAARHAGKQP